MTLTISAQPSTAENLTSTGQRTVLLQPGLAERALVVVATFTFLHSTPNVWFWTYSEALADGSNPLAAVVILTFIGIAFARVAGSIDHLIAMVRLDPTVFLVAGLMLASIFWTADLFQTGKEATIMIGITLYAAYLVLRFSLDQILRMLAMMFVLSALLNLAFIVALPEYGIDAVGNLTGLFPQKNALGYAATLGVPCLLAAGKDCRRARIFFYPTALVQIGLLIGSQSKTMLLATMVPTALIPIYHLFRSRRTLRGAVMLCMGGSALFAVAFATANIGLLAQWLDKDVSLTGRVPLWADLVPIAMERPFTGHGYGATFAGFYSPVHEVLIQNQWNPTHAHNALLQLWLEIGVIGVLLFLVLYFRAVSRAIKIVAVVPGAVGLWPLVFLTTTLMVSITESGVNSDRLGWMMFVVAVLSASMHLRHRSRIGLSNDLREATDANAQRRASA